MRPSLARLTLRGFKTIRELKDFEPGRLMLLIGPNGAGKTNFVSFFRMLARALTPPGELQLYVAEQGGASMILHDGSARTPDLQAAMEIQTDQDRFQFGFQLSHAAGDTLVFADEYFELKRGIDVGSRRSGHREAQLIARAESGESEAGYILHILKRVVVHQFHDTSPRSRLRNKWAVDDGKQLKEDGANLAPFLYRLRDSEPKYYQRIRETIRLILPFFADFELAVESGYLILRWRERGSDHVFNASQAADGMLRIMALVALLQQPEKDLPAVLILDEPELGLHPYAIEVLAALTQSASRHVQVIAATQSVSLIDRFEPHDIVVTERIGKESTFRRLSDSDLSEWLDKYTLSELWEKNVLGGRPAR